MLRPVDCQEGATHWYTVHCDCCGAHIDSTPIRGLLPVDYVKFATQVETEFPKAKCELESKGWVFIKPWMYCPKCEDAVQDKLSFEEELAAHRDGLAA
jgi:hypothetical protein